MRLVKTFYDTTHEIWNVVKETYSNVDNTVELFGTKGPLHDLRQSEMNVTRYYNTLNHFWQQVDMYENSDWECP